MSTSKTTQQRAKELFDRAWIDKGISQEDLDQNAQLGRLFNDLLRQGRRADEIQAEWEQLTLEEILRKYDGPPPVPVKEQ